jgi:hypothetical protein
VSPIAHHFYLESESGKTSKQISEATSETHNCYVPEEVVSTMIETLRAAMNREGVKIDARFTLRIPLVPAPIVGRIAKPLSSLVSPAIAIATAAAIVILAALDFALFPARSIDGSGVALAYLLFLVSLVFHEIGHSSAIARFGRKPGGIGFGFFAIFPVFYSDVTEAWHLSRKQRIALDLSGIYFQAVLAVPLLLADFAFGFAPARLAVLMIAASYIYSLNPFIKSDGYWALADALGAPWLERDTRRNALSLFGWGERRKPVGLFTRLLSLAYVLATAGWWGWIALAMTENLRFLPASISTIANCSKVACWTVPQSVLQVAGATLAAVLTVAPILLFAKMAFRQLTRVLKTGFAIAILCAIAGGATLAASSRGDIRIQVRDGANGAALQYATTYVIGARTYKGLTDSSGEVEFDDLPVGAYTVRSYLDGYTEAEQTAVAVNGDQRTEVTIMLARPGSLKPIATVSVRYRSKFSPSGGTDDDYRLAFGTTPLDSIGQYSQATMFPGGIGLNGHDPSQTQFSINGVPVSAPGRGGGNSLFGSNLFSALSIGSGSYGAAGGTINVESPDPTLNWLTQVTTELGNSNGRAYSISRRGTAGFVGLSFGHAANGLSSRLDGSIFTDASLLDYKHQEGSYTSGDSFKMNAPIGGHSLGFDFVQISSQTTTTCNIQTSFLPCSFGLGSSEYNDVRSFALHDQTKMGKVPVWLTVFRNSGGDGNVVGTSAPGGSLTGDAFAENWNSGGWSFAATPIVGRKGALNVGYSTYLWTSSVTYPNYEPINDLGGYRWSQGWMQYQHRLSRNVRIDSSLLHETINGQSHQSLYLTASDTDHNDSYWISFASTPENAVGSNAYVSPASSLAFVCGQEGALGYGPTSQNTVGNSSRVAAQWHHKARHAEFSFQVFHQIEKNAPITGLLSANALPANLFDPAYMSDANQAFHAPSICGSSAPPLDLSKIYLAVNGTAPTIERAGAYGATRIELGRHAFVQPYFWLESAREFGLSDTIGIAGSSIIPGRQIPSNPVARYGGLVNMDVSKHSEALLAWNHVSPGNPLSTSSLDTFDFAIQTRLRSGSAITAFVDNITNTASFPFVSPVGSIGLVGGGRAPILAYPLPPRSFGVRFDLRARRSLASGDDQETSLRLEPLPLPSAAPVEPFAIQRESPMCRAQDVALAEKQLGDIRTYASELEHLGGVIAADRTIDNLRLTSRATPNGFAVGVTVTDSGDALFRCATLHAGPIDDLRTIGAYVPTHKEVTDDRTFIWFGKRVGLYIVTDEVPDVVPTPHFAQLPLASPLSPLAVVQGASCPIYMRGAAQSLLGELGNIIAAWRQQKPMPPSTSWIATSKSSGTHWLDLKLTGAQMTEVMAVCATVHQGTIAELNRVGLGVPEASHFGYADRVGLFVGPDGLGK